MVLKLERKTLIKFFLCFAIIGCKCQDGKVDTLKQSSRSFFEEKQKKEISKTVSETTILNPNFSFRQAAKKVTAGVVHIKSSYSYDSHPEFLEPIYNEFWYRFFSERGLIKPQTSGSGVIISSDGYIVTNEHVVVDAEKIEILLQNQKVYTAKIIGLDPITDLALIKIDDTHLPFIEFGNSDELEVGDWVLAVGNPLELLSTVTAGIVSAKARNINILKKKGAVEAYIQTDAAINVGNSGGALVDYNGKLVGINSAIASLSGSYTGYSFATPVNMVKKIIDDLLIHGKVKRGHIGAAVKNVTAKESVYLNTNMTTGVYVDSLTEVGAPKETDLKLKDIITAVDNHNITTSVQLQEVIEQHRPGEKLIFTIIRQGNEKQISVALKEYTSPFLSKAKLLKDLGIKIQELSDKEKNQTKLPGGIKVIEISEGKIFNNTNIKKGFIITRINGKRVDDEKEFVNAFENADDSMVLEGIYPFLSKIFYYEFAMD